MSTFGPTAQARPLPDIIQMGLEYERRRRTAPPQVQDFMREYRRRGLLAPAAPGPEASDPAAQQRLARERFQQIQQKYEPPSDDDRAWWIKERMNQFIARQQKVYLESARGRQEWDERNPGFVMGSPTQMLFRREPTLDYEQKERVWQSMKPMLPKVEEQLGKQFDTLHSPMTRFQEQRDQGGQWLAQGFRNAHPDASDQEVYNYVHENLAVQGYQPSIAGQMEAVVDKAELAQQLRAAEVAGMPLVDQMGVAGLGYAPVTGVVKSFQDTLAGVAGTMGMGGIAWFLEETTGSDFGFRDYQDTIEHYWTVTAQDNFLLGRAQQKGATGDIIRFADLMGQVTGDLAQTMLATSMGVGAARWAGFSARLTRMVGTLTGMGFMGIKEGAGASRTIHASLMAQGYSETEARQRAMYGGLAVGVVNALLEYLPIKQFSFLKKGTNLSRLQGALRGWIVEGTQEGLQEGVNLLAEWESGAMADRPLFSWDNLKRIGLASLAGGLVGGAVGVMTRAGGLEGEVTVEAIREIMDAKKAQQQILLEARKPKDKRPDRGPQPIVPVKPEPGRLRSDPKIIATATQLGAWYRKTYGQEAGAIEALASMAKDPQTGKEERFRLVNVPLALMTVEDLGQTDAQAGISQAKIAEIAALSDKEIAEMPPLIALANPAGPEAVAPLDVVDGRHRLRALQQREGVATMWAYVPESLAKQIEAGTLRAAPPEVAPGPRPGEGVEVIEGVEPTERPPDVVPPPVAPPVQPPVGPPAPVEPPVEEPPPGPPERPKEPERYEPPADINVNVKNLYEMATQAAAVAGTEAQRRETLEAIAKRARVIADQMAAVPGKAMTGRRGATWKAATALAERLEAELGVGPPAEVEPTERVERAEEAFEREYDLRRIDPLTGIYNRLGGDEAIADMIEKADEKKVPLAIGGIDLILFKQVNDVLGHDAGDALLIEVGRILETEVRAATDKREADVGVIVSRRGGDEFELLLWNVDTVEKARIAEDRLRKSFAQAVEKLGIKLPGPLVPGMGIGWTIRQPGDTRKTEALRREADVELTTRKTEIRKELGIPEGRAEPERIIREAVEAGWKAKPIEGVPPRAGEIPPYQEVVPEGVEPEEAVEREGRRDLSREDIQRAEEARAEARRARVPPEEVSPGDVKVAERFETLASGMQGQIDKLRTGGIRDQAVTRRRAGQIASLDAQANELERVQAAMRGLAKAHREDRVPSLLIGVSNRAQVETLVRKGKAPEFWAQVGDLQDVANYGKGKKGVDALRQALAGVPARGAFHIIGKEGIEAVATFAKLHKTNEYIQKAAKSVRDAAADALRMDKAGIPSDAWVDARAALQLLYDVAAIREAEVTKAKEAERKAKLGLRRAPGYFPTPAALATRMAETADVDAGDRVLEPSAGEGALLRAIGEEANLTPEVLEGYEIARDLVEDLHSQGFTGVEQGDFLEQDPEPVYDAVVMNPPFEKGQDIDHVRHAYKFLKPGGRLVAIMSEGSFSRSDKKATAFQGWLADLKGKGEKLPEDTFAGVEALRRTGVNARLVTITKAEGVPTREEITPPVAEEAPPPAPPEPVAPPKPPEPAPPEPVEGEAPAKKLTDKQAQAIVDQYEQITPEVIPGTQVLKGPTREQYLDAAAQLGTLKQHNYRDAKLFLFPPGENRKWVKAQAKAIKEFEEEEARPAPKRAYVPPRRLGVPTGPPLPGRVASVTALAKRIGRMARPTKEEKRHKGVKWSPNKALFSDGGWVLLELKLKEGTGEQFKKSDFTGLPEPPLIEDAFSDALMKKEEATTTMDIPTMIRYLRSLRIITRNPEVAPVFVVNPDGSLGMAIADSGIGMVELNVQREHRTIERGTFNPGRGLQIIEEMYAAGAQEVTMYLEPSWTHGVAALVFTAETPTRSLRAILAGAKFAEGVPTTVAEVTEADLAVVEAKRERAEREEAERARHEAEVEKRLAQVGRVQAAIDRGIETVEPALGDQMRTSLEQARRPDNTVAGNDLTEHAAGQRAGRFFMWPERRVADDSISGYAILTIGGQEELIQLAIVNLAEKTKDEVQEIVVNMNAAARQITPPKPKGPPAAGAVGMPMAPGPDELGFSADEGMTVDRPPKIGESKVPPAEQPPPRDPDNWTSDLEPLRAREGAFKRRPADKPRRVNQALAAARARRQAKHEDPAIDNIYRIVSDLARRFNVGPPGIGRAQMLSSWAAGFYRPWSEAIRLKRGSYVDVFIHELGHHLHVTLFPRVGKPTKKRLATFKDFPPAWTPDLIKLGKALYGEKQPVGGYRSEGWAETVRLLLSDPGGLKRAAPTVYADLVPRLVQHHPSVWAALMDARVRILNAIELGTRDPIDKFIAHEKAPGGFSWRNLYDDMRSRLFDRYQRLVTFKQDLGLEDVPAHLDPHIAALRANGHISGELKLMMERGTFKPGDPTRAPTGPGLIEILTPVRRDLRLWQNYMVARRTIEKRAQGFGAVMPEDPQAPRQASTENLENFIRRTELLHPQWGDYFKQRGPRVVVKREPDGRVLDKPSEDPTTVAARFRQFNRWMIQSYAVHYGLLSPESAQIIVQRNLEYITFRHKKVEDALMRKYGLKAAARGGFVSMTSGVRRFREGMGEQLFPPLESFMVSMQGIVSRAQLNNVAQKIVAFSAQPGGARWLDTIRRPMDATKLAGTEIGREIYRQLGIGLTPKGELVVPDYLKDLDEGAFDELMMALEGLQGRTFWKPGNRTDQDNREFWVMRRGKPIFYETKDARLFDVLEGLGGPAGATTLMRVLRFPGRMLRAGATQYNPSFFIPNFIRDLSQALTMTETNMAKLPEQARLRAQAMKQAFTGGDWLELFKASGADMSGIFGEYYNPNTATLDFDRMFERPKLGSTIKGDNAKEIARDLVRLGPIDRLNRGFEMANRMGEFAVSYTQAKAMGKPEAEAMAIAGQAGADVTLDFQRGGTWSKQVNEIVVFFNAAMLGADKLARFIKKNPLKAAARIFSLIVMPSIIQLLLNLDEDDYWAKPKGMRDRYWYFPTGHDDLDRPTYLKLPKPYGLGIFGIATERSFALLFGIDPETGKRGDPGALSGIASAFIDELRPTFNIAGLQPLIEVLVGDRGWSFYRDREIVSMADQDLPLGEQGSTRSSELARFLGSMLNFPPAKIDYLIQGWTGGLGRDAVQVGVDPIIRILDPRAKQGEPMQYHDWLVVRRFLAGHTRSGHEAISRFYEQLVKLRRVNAGLNARKDKPVEYRDYRLQHREQLILYKEYTRAQSKMSKEFREVRRMYRQRERYNAKEIEQRIDKLYGIIIHHAQRAHRFRQARKAKD